MSSKMMRIFNRYDYHLIIEAEWVVHHCRAMKAASWSSHCVGLILVLEVLDLYE